MHTFFFQVGHWSLEVMEKVEVYEAVKVPEEMESYNQMDVTTSKKRKSIAEEDGGEKTKKPR